MPTKVLFERIDEIPWATLRHAYGPADDVPAMLRALACGDDDAREQAFEDLFGTIWHQGTVYDATVAALPFLLELLGDEEHADRIDLLILFAAIAGGQGYYQVHAGPQRTLYQSQLDHEDRVVTALRERIAPHLGLLLANLEHADPQLRQTVAEALVFFPSHRSKSLEALRRAIQNEGREGIRETMEASYRTLSSQPPT